VLLVRAALVVAVGLMLASSSCSVADLTAGGPVEPDARAGGRGGSAGSDSRGTDAESGNSGAGDTADGGAFVAPAASVTIENLLNNRYLDVSNVSTSDGAQVWTWSYTGRLNQLWSFMAMGEGTYEIVNNISNKCLDVRAQTTMNGSFIQQFGCNGGDNQRWSIKHLEGHEQIVGRQSGRCLSSSAMEDGATVTILDCSDDPSQRWAIGR
jgi:hypothetical protein